MRKKWKVLVLVLVFLIGSRVIYTTIKPKPIEPKPIEPPKEETYIISKAENIKNIKINLKKTDEIIDFSKDNNGIWNEISGAKINQSLVEGLALTISDLQTKTKVLKENIDYGEFGLRDSSIVVTYTTKDDKTGFFIIGSQTNSKEGYYVTRENDTSVYILPSYNIKNFTNNILFFVDLEIQFSNLSNVKYIYFKQKDGIEIEIIDDIMQKPIANKKLYKDYIQKNILDVIENIKLERVVDVKPILDEGLYGFDNPTYEIILKDDTKELHLIYGKEFDSGKFDDHIFYTRYVGRDEIFISRKTEIQQLLEVSPDSLIDKSK